MQLLNNYGDPTDSFKRAIRAHYNKLREEGEDARNAGHATLEWASEEINKQGDILTHGVEFAMDSYGSIGNWALSGIEYINFGDMYYSNICFDMRSCRFRWMPIANIIERECNRFKSEEY